MATPSLTLLDRIKDLDNLAKAQERVVDFFSLSYAELPFLSTTEIAERAKVSKATITRMVQQLGYGGFDELRDELRLALYTHTDAPAGRVRLGSTQDFERALAVHKEQELRNVKETLERLDTFIVQSLCERLVHAQRIWVYGQRFSYGIAFNLGLFLSQLLPAVFTVSGAAGTTADAFSVATSNDYVLLIAHRRVGAEKAALVRLLHGKKIPYSVITDVSDVDPFTEAEFILRTTTNAVGAFHCYASSHAVVQALVSAMEVCAPTAVRRLTETEVALQHLHAFSEKGGAS